MGLCKYRDVFGAPGTGAHSKRFMGIAVVDTVLTFILIYFVKQISGATWLRSAVGTFAFAEACHIAFCVDTPVAKFLKSLLPLDRRGEPING